jgi:tetratricopeptide (TPR) repeat protein
MRGPAAAALLLTSWSLWGAWPTWLPSSLRPHLPVWAERVLYNPRERTAQAMAAVGRGEPPAAVPPAETALRLAPDDPLVQYDAGTALLAAGGLADRGRAVEVLERAARSAGPDFAAAANYNLGNARLAARDPAGAVEAFKQALRLEPGNADAKFNLELALREKLRQPPQLPLPPKGSGPLQGNRPSDDPGGKSEGDQDRGGSGAGTGDQESGDQGQGGQGDTKRTGRSPLSNFRDQPGMNAAEAAALLRAVENLERQQRRDLAARQARQRAAEDRDW